MIVKTVNPSWLCLICFLPLCCLVNGSWDVANSTLSMCGQMMRDSNGTIHTPNFPKAFPVPLRCRWIIRGYNQSQIIIVFTQYVLRHSLYISEYDYFESDQTYRNKHYIGEINAESEADNLVSYRQYVVIDLMVKDAMNINIKVDEYLIDYHGFNITYMILPSHAKLQPMCSFHYCTYLGNCLVGADFSTFYCNCFQGFWTSQCNRGPHCDPDSGNNACLNGGKCKYVFGSQFNACECPPNYSGDMCENQILPRKNESSTCSHQAVDETVCDHGNQHDNTTTYCVDEERYRVIVRLNIIDLSTHVLADQLLEHNKQQLTDQGLHWLKHSQLISAKYFNIDSISEQNIEFHFYIDKITLPLVNQALKELIHEGNIFGVKINQSQLSVQLKPESKFLSLEMSEENPVIEGRMFTLTCIAKGSENIQFRWLKNGKPLNLSLTHRNAWEIRLPENIQGKHISVFNIDGITVYDKGQFTCEINDFGCSTNGSVFVKVLPLPVVQVDPLSASLTKGSSQTLRCISAVDKNQHSTYSWLKNNKMLNPNNNEIVENIYPTGSHLFIRSAESSTNYTCKVTNHAGTSSKTVFIFVVEDNNEKSCPPQKLHSILWNQTFGGFYYFHNCPDNSGFAKRYCNCSEQSCEWEEPNFAHCHWRLFLKVHDDIMNIQMAYMEKTLCEILEDFYNLTTLGRSKMFAGDLDLASQILLMIVTIAKDFPSMICKQFDLTKLMELINILFEETLKTTVEEKRELSVGKRLLQTVEIFTDLKIPKHFDLIDAEFTKINLKTVMMTALTYTKSVKFNLISSKNETIQETVVQTQPVLVVHFNHTLLQLVGNEQNKDLNEQFISDVYSYFPIASSQNIRNSFIINISHHKDYQHSASDEIHCMSWKIDKLLDSFSVLWMKNSCSTVKILSNQTQCLCTLPGHFTLVSIASQNSETQYEYESLKLQAVLIISQAICLLSLLIIIAIYLRVKRCLQESRNFIHFNFTLSLVGINIVCILCLMQPKKEILCLCGKVVLQLFTISAFTFLLLDAIQILVDLLARQHSHIIIGTFKFIIIGWGIPTLSVVCAILTLEVAGYDKRCNIGCWWSPQHHHFYSVLITAILLVLGQLGALSVCVVIVTQWNDEWSYRNRKKFLYEIGQGVILQILLVVFISLGIFNDIKAQSSQGLVLFFSIILSLTFFSSFVVSKNRIRSTLKCTNGWKGGLTISCNNQEKPAHNDRNEMEKIQEYCDCLDREQYTVEHNRQIRSLLTNNNLISSSTNSIQSLTKENGMHNNIINNPKEKVSLDAGKLMAKETAIFT